MKEELLAPLDSRLVRLVYASRAKNVFKSQDIAELLSVARANNLKLGITGALFYHNQNFLQCLEGSARAVSRIFSKIATDTRHEDIVFISYDEISCRGLEDWSMGLVGATEINQKICKKFTADPIFNPFLLNADNAIDFLLELKADALIVGE